MQLVNFVDVFITPTITCGDILFVDYKNLKHICRLDYQF